LSADSVIPRSRRAKIIPLDSDPIEGVHRFRARFLPSRLTHERFKMISRLSPSPEGISPVKIAERAWRLFNEGCPTYSTAWYQAYDELLHTTVRTPPSNAGHQTTVVAESKPVEVFRPLQPQVMRPEVLTADEILARVRASEERKRQPVPPERPSPNSVEEVLAADELDFDALSAYLSVRAVMAYGSKREIENQLGTEQGCTNVTYFEKGHTAAFGYTLHKHAFLAFRGSRLPFRKNMTWLESIEILWSDWVRTDFNCIPWYRPMRHLGFARAWSRIRKQVTNWLGSLPKDSQLVLTGHSLGGGLAVVAAFDLVEHYPIRAVVTFGAPRVGLPRFRLDYHVKRCGGQTLHAITRRYTHETDLVSRIPPPVLYCHVGDESVVHSSGAIEKGRPVGRVARFEEWLESSSLKESPKRGLISFPPVPPKPSLSLSRDQRAKLALAKFIQQLKLVVPLVMHDSSRQLLWIASSGIGILFCAAGWQDLRRHSSGKYVKAYEKKFPRLTRRENDVSRLIDRMLDNLMKGNPPGNQA
jgi:lipase (class 3)